MSGLALPTVSCHVGSQLDPASGEVLVSEVAIEGDRFAAGALCLAAGHDPAVSYLTGTVSVVTKG